MTCKDCAHYDVCNYWVKKQYGENRYLEAREGFICEDFKDKSKFIELPCNAGDTVYIITALMNIVGFDLEEFDEMELEEHKVFECKVGSITIYNNESSMQARLYHNNQFVVHYIQPVDFGKIVFLTNEEAEAALKEREQNDTSGNKA